MAVSASRKAKVELVAESRGMDAGLKDAARKLRLFEREQIKAAKTVAREQARADKEAARERQRSMGALGGGMKAVGFGAAAATGFDIAGGIGGMVTDIFDFEKKLTRFQIAARKTKPEMESMRSAILGISNETGLAKSEVLAGAQAFLDLAGAGAYSDQTMKTIARTSQATGSAITDVATMAFSLGDAFKIDPSQMEATLSGLVNQSKDGAVHFNQMAGEIIAIAPQFVRFGVTGRKGANELGAMFQVVRTGFKGAEETSTGLQGVFKGLKLHADRFAKSGVQVFNIGKDGTKTFKPLEEIFTSISKSSLMKDPQALGKAFGRGEGEQAFNMIMTHIEQYRALVAAGEDATAVAKDLETVLTSPAGKMEAAWNNLKNAISAALTPERIAAFADAVAGLADKLAPVAAIVGKVGDVLGGIYGFGKNIGETITGYDGKHVQADIEDARIITQEGLGTARGQGARARILDVAAYNHSTDAIDAELTPARQLQKALQFKYTQTQGIGHVGEQQAGTNALKAMGYVDPVDVQRQMAIDFAKAVTDAMKNVNVTVKVNPNDVHGGTANAHTRATTPRGAR